MWRHPDNVTFFSVDRGCKVNWRLTAVCYYWLWQPNCFVFRTPRLSVEDRIATEFQFYRYIFPLLLSSSFKLGSCSGPVSNTTNASKFRWMKWKPYKESNELTRLEITYFSEDVCKTNTAGRCDNIPAYSYHVEQSWKFRDWMQFVQGINMMLRDPQLFCMLRRWVWAFQGRSGWGRQRW